MFPGAVITILFALVRLFKEAVQFYYDPKTYLSDLANWIEIALYILSIIFVSVFRTTCMCSQEWQWQLGVVVIFFAWIDLIVICAKSPSIGIYIIMFGKIFLTFLKAVILPVLLVIMFGLTFYMTFSEPEFQVGDTTTFYHPLCLGGLKGHYIHHNMHGCAGTALIGPLFVNVHSNDRRSIVSKTAAIGICRLN